MNRPTYHQLMTAYLGGSIKTPKKCPISLCFNKPRFWYIFNKKTINEINVRCLQHSWGGVTKVELNEKEIFLIQLRPDF